MGGHQRGVYSWKDLETGMRMLKLDALSNYVNMTKVKE